MNRILLIALILFTSSCSYSKKDEKIPSFYTQPKQNDLRNLYGVGQGYTLEEATKYSLSDLASKLMVTISSKSTLIREENQYSVNEELRNQVKQNIEKIDFTNYEIINSKQIGQNFYVETKVDRFDFVGQQEQQINFLEKKINNLAKAAKNKNIIQKRNNLRKILKNSKELELKARILNGAGKKIDLDKILAKQLKFKNQFNALSYDIEFYIDAKNNKKIANIIKNSLNKEKLKVTKVKSTSKKQIIIKVSATSSTNNIYHAFVTKLRINFENISNNKIIASNSIEVSGGSTISKKESYASALEDLKKRVKSEGIMKTIGVE